jgi:hypothetical protein
MNIKPVTQRTMDGGIIAGIVIGGLIVLAYAWCFIYSCIYPSPPEGYGGSYVGAGAGVSV